MGDAARGRLGQLLQKVVKDVVVAQAAVAQIDHEPVSYTHLRAHETVLDLVCRLLLEKKKTEHNS